MHTQSAITHSASVLPPAKGPVAAGRAVRRVLMIVESSAGGTGRHVLDLAEALVERGCAVHVIHSNRRIDKFFSQRLAEMPRVSRAALPLRTAPHPSDLSAWRFIRRYAREHGPFDVIHGHSSKGGALARLAALGSPAAAIYTLHGLIMMDPLLPAWKWLLYLSIEIGLSLGTSRIIAVSPEESRAAKKLRLGNRRVITIPNGVGPAVLATREQARREMGAGERELVIGFIGRLVEQKAPEVLIEAFAQAVEFAPHARLALVGGGPLEPDLRLLSERIGVADKIIWLGERDARGVIAGFDLFALSSRKEGLPYVVLEAMAAGLPVVATSSSGVEILIDPGVSGLVVPPDDARAFGNALTSLLVDQPLLQRMGQASRERAALFTIDLMADRTLDAYAAAMREGTHS